MSAYLPHGTPHLLVRLAKDMQRELVPQLRQLRLVVLALVLQCLASSNSYGGRAGFIARLLQRIMLPPQVLLSLDRPARQMHAQYVLGDAAPKGAL